MLCSYWEYNLKTGAPIRIGKHLDRSTAIFDNAIADGEAQASPGIPPLARIERLKNLLNTFRRNARAIIFHQNLHKSLLFTGRKLDPGVLLVGGLAGGRSGAVRGGLIGAAGGALIGGMRRSSQRDREDRNREQWEREETNNYVRARNEYNLAFSACMTGRGYTVK